MCLLFNIEAQTIISKTYSETSMVNGNIVLNGSFETFGSGAGGTLTTAARVLKPGPTGPFWDNIWLANGCKNPPANWTAASKFPGSPQNQWNYGTVGPIYVDPNSGKNVMGNMYGNNNCQLTLMGFDGLFSSGTGGSYSSFIDAAAPQGSNVV